MIEPGIYGAPPGADFAASLVSGLQGWAIGRPPEALARATVFVNTRRLERRVRKLFDAGPNLLLPRVRLVGEIGHHPASTALPPAASSLQQTLALARLVAGLIEAAPDVAPRRAVFDLAASLSALFDEMGGEGVGLDALQSLDVADQSGHWARAQSFLSLVGAWQGDQLDMTATARLRRATEAVIAAWEADPPEDPVIVAGSTGSRGTTALLMEAVARLPSGILLLPGFDFDLPAPVWAHLQADTSAEDHPQFRFARLLSRLGIEPSDVRRSPLADAPDPGRNRLISLALRPAPVTDQWLSDGPRLGDLAGATGAVTLIEAPRPRAEAETIALILRTAARAGKTAALVSPDRMLTRRVTALLGRWDIEPDDSAGRPLTQSPPGRLLLQISAFLGQGATSVALLALLKHPLVHPGDGRNAHLLQSRALERFLRRTGQVNPDPSRITAWAERKGACAPDWARWVADLLLVRGPDAATPAGHMEAVVGLAERCAGGPDGTGPGGLWEREAGRKARACVDAIAREGADALDVTPETFDTLLRATLDAEDVRDQDNPHPRVLIWGTLEARVQGTDLVILGGLNEGSWPEAPPPDPWLNRRMRAEAGLLSPERRIGLSAHDFQQAAAAPEVVLSRSLKSDEGELLPSRWLNRLTNLMAGLPETGGPDALAAMRRRGALWMDLAASIAAPEGKVTPAARPSPRPPVEDRPGMLYVTDIQRLKRDPYAVYARRILGLRKLDPLHPAPDAPLRGEIIHRIFERHMTENASLTGPDAIAGLLRIADQVLAERAPWPMVRHQWFARIERIADWFVDMEAARADARFEASEVSGRLTLPETGFELRATADRLDRLADGGLAVIDYKTGKPPTEPMIRNFDPQLLLEAMIAEAGGFKDVPAGRVDYVAHIGLGVPPVFAAYDLTGGGAFSVPATRAALLDLLAYYGDSARGYTARPAMQKVAFEGDYDHLARFGEWDDSSSPEPEDVG